ncbi:MAG: thiamine pyrophosphate-dependent dehydrogenase E1 component subunit alpha [Alphaproteobacteria bacterium]
MDLAQPATVAQHQRSTMSQPDADTRIRLYKSLLRVRNCEETLAELYREQEMRTPTHFGVGQEAVAVGVSEAMAPDDVAYSHHRCHNHYLAKGGSILGLAAELYGRLDGCSEGRGGSVHLTARDQGFIVSSAILGQTVAVAVGSALAFKMDGESRVAVTFFGEAACEEGVFYESLNYASIHALPVLFVCENNLYSTESPLDVRQPQGTDLCERTKAFKVESERIDGNDVVAVHQAAAQSLALIRDGGGPRFLECMTYRWREHVGPNFDHEVGRTYRDKAELESWMKKCPVLRAGRGLVEDGLATDTELETWDGEIKTVIAKAIADARASDWPDPKTLFDNVE